MDDWEIETTRIIKALEELETDNPRQQVIKLAVMVYLYKSLESEETFNNNCEILDNVNYEEMRLKRFEK